MFDFNKTTKLSRGQQHVFLGYTEVSGVQNIDVNFSTPEEQIAYIGMGKHYQKPMGPRGGNVRIQSFFLGDDHFIDLTGDAGFNGYVVQSAQSTGNNFGFESGYLTQYSQRCTLGEVPQLAAQFTVFGRVGELHQADSLLVSGDLEGIYDETGPTYDLHNINAGSIELDFGTSAGDFERDRLTSYQLDIACPRQPYYRLGGYYPSQIDTQYPIQATLAVSFDVSHITPMNNYEQPCNLYGQGTNQLDEVTLKLKDFTTDETVKSYTFTKFRFMGQNYSVNAAGAPTIELQYRTLILKAGS